MIFIKFIPKIVVHMIKERKKPLGARKRMHVFDPGITLTATVGQHLSDVPSVEKSWGYTALATFKIFCTNQVL